MFVTIFVLTFSMISLLGWGTLLRRLLGLPAGNWPTTIALGLAGFIWIGGWLNVAGIAYGIVLQLAVIAGWILAGRELWKIGKPLKQMISGWLDWVKRNLAQSLSVAVPIVVIVGFNAATLVPTNLYNVRDDFQKYFIHPVRMLDTGTLSGSPLSTSGYTELGGRAMLDGVLLSILPLQYLVSVDAVFGLALCLLLAINLAAGRKTSWAIAMLGPLAVYLINPQSVNITALYLGSAILLAAFSVCADPRERHKQTGWPSAILLGVCYGTLVCLKMSFALVIAIHFAVLAIAMLAECGQILPLTRWAGVCFLSALASVLPWVLVHLPNYLAIGSQKLVAADAGPNPPDSADLFRWTPLHYMSRPLAYTTLIGAVWMISAGAGWLALRRKSADRQRALAVCAGGQALTIAYFVMLFFVSPRLSGYFQSYRYFTATIIGLAPAVMASGLLIIDDALSAKPVLLRTIPPLLLGVLPLSLFVPTLGERMSEQIHFGTNLAYVDFATSRRNIEYCGNLLSDRTRENVRKLQSLIPEGEPMLAWFDSAFYLDFSRNRVYDIDTAGIAAPWARMPEARYLILQYKGLAVRQQANYEHDSNVPGASDRLIARKSYAFLQRLMRRLERSRVIYDDGFFKVVELTPE